MNVLGIETATSICSVGLTSETGLIADYRLCRKNIHGEILPEVIEYVLRSSGMSHQVLDGVAVSIGPGSFTGLRIGLGVAKGLALGWNIPIVAVPTMDGLVSMLPGAWEWTCVLLVARKAEVYRGLYQCKKSNWKKVGDIQVIQQDKIGEGLPEEEIVFLGEGVSCHLERITQQVKRVRFLPPVYSLSSGFSIAEIGRDLLKAEQKADLASLIPLYVKRFQGVP